MSLQHLIDNNIKWAEGRKQIDPEIFIRQSKFQKPKYLWIGCADSRIPANVVLGLDPGQVFVHRNVANLVPHVDFNCLSVLQYGIDYLGVEHIIVCGHHGCGGVKAAMEQTQFGLVDNWLRHIRDVYYAHKTELCEIEDKEERYNRLVELNVMHQVKNVCHTTVVHNAWMKNRKISVHGWVYEINTGLVQDLNCSISSLDQIDSIFRTDDVTP
eukprot:GHVL01027396.1.p1 GENE.GHVL01027396.1~~GHVL01027396.1.p1  ORF type:complete len:213 (+),score=18.38 GHVL01027396.1:20-658(+)